ncbi:hypothetical protein [Saccharomonospora iraqiensis]|uniref:hypothetical protein n=1 Tax=Saccharomonospora iraqiensis TaxID=52698 RepID=UPI00022E8993|nr:hypothetical protein [Saccharomonospora iraqiensis]
MAAGELPVELVQAADQQLETVVRYVQHAGGLAGEQFTAEIGAVQAEVRTMLGRLADVQERLRQAAQQVLHGGGG